MAEKVHCVNAEVVVMEQEEAVLCESVSKSSDPDSDQDGSGSRDNDVKIATGSRTKQEAVAQESSIQASLEEFDDDKMLYPMKQESFQLEDPKTLLDLALKRADEVTESGVSEDLAVQWRIKCVALTRLVHGDLHWKMGQSYGNLAQAYLELKSLPQQACHHGCRAKEILLLPTSNCSQSVEAMNALIRAYITVGYASLSLQKPEDSVKAFTRAGQEREKMKKTLKEDLSPDCLVQIQLGLGKSLCRVKHYEKSRDALMKGVELVRMRPDSKPVVSALQELAEACSGCGDYTSAVAHLREAKSLASKEFGQSTEEVAQIDLQLAKALMSTLNTDEEDSIVELMQEAHKILCELEQDGRAAECLEELCKFHVQTNKTALALQHLKTVLKLKKSAFGDFSTEVGESLRLTGTIHLSQGNMAEATKHLKKSLDILNVTLGKKHKNTVEVERVLALAAMRNTKSSVAEKPRFKTVFGAEDTAMKSSVDGKRPKKASTPRDNRPPFSIYLKNDAFW